MFISRLVSFSVTCSLAPAAALLVNAASLMMCRLICKTLEACFLLHIHWRGETNAQSRPCVQGQAGMTGVLVPLCELLHSAEADVFISRGSDREISRKTEFSKRRDSWQMEKNLQTGRQIHSHFHTFRLTLWSFPIILQSIFPIPFLSQSPLWNQPLYFSFAAGTKGALSPCARVHFRLSRRTAVDNNDKITLKPQDAILPSDYVPFHLTASISNPHCTITVHHVYHICMFLECRLVLFSVLSCGRYWRFCFYTTIPSKSKNLVSKQPHTLHWL